MLVVAYLSIATAWRDRPAVQKRFYYVISPFAEALAAWGAVQFAIWIGAQLR